MRVAASIILAMAVPAWATLDMRLPSPYGDARYGRLHQTSLTNMPQQVAYNVILPRGDFDGFTVTGWARVVQTNNASQLTTFAFWCGDPQIKSAPDLLAGVGAHGVAAGTNLTDLGGSITVASFPWQSYSEAHLVDASNTWPKGVYTIDGWASNAVTVTLGGTDYTFPAGRVHRNAEPGAADSVVISGSGLASIGISRTPCYRFNEEFDGVNSGATLTAGCFSNEIVFVAWRFSIDGANQLYRSDMGDMESWSALGLTRTNAAPLAGKFSSLGYYRIGFNSPVAAPPYDVEFFDARVLPWRLTDRELERVHYNGVQEINRRGIPQWR